MKAVVFDMDGVLFDTERLGFAAWDYASEKMNVPPASELAQISAFMPGIYIPVFCGKRRAAKTVS